MSDAEIDARPRFMTDAQLREHFGLSERALKRLRMTAVFPKRDELIGRTDSKAVDNFFDKRAGLAPGDMTGYLAADGHENFERFR